MKAARGISSCFSHASACGATSVAAKSATFLRKAISAVDNCGSQEAGKVGGFMRRLGSRQTHGVTVDVHPVIFAGCRRGFQDRAAHNHPYGVARATGLR